MALVHGSDFHWNETMRRAVEPLAGRYGGARDPPRSPWRPAVVVVRIFGKEASFRSSVQRMLGLDVEAAGGFAPPLTCTPAPGTGTGTEPATATVKVNKRREYARPWRPWP